jgi:hypothetical protein
MYFDADVVCDEPHDAFSIGGCDPAAGVFETPRQTVDPQATVGIEHYLDDCGIFQVGRDGGSECGAQHARAAGESFRSEGNRRHYKPRKLASLGSACVSGVD